MRLSQAKKSRITERSSEKFYKKLIIYFNITICVIDIFFIETEFDKKCQFLKIFLAKSVRPWH